MVGWHYWLSGHEIEQSLGDSKGQGSLACCSPRSHKNTDTTEQLNNCSVSSSPSRQTAFKRTLHSWGNTSLIDKRFIIQFSSVAQSCLTLCDPMNRSMPGLPVHHQHLEFTQTHVHLTSDATQPSHPLSSPSPPAPNPSQYQSLFQCINSSHEVAKVLEFQL